ncbi:MAG: TonB-dependent receptor [Undibacterium sp.]|nr:TonB-dependent receptor [Opitutaceae bacterium]
MNVTDLANRAIDFEQSLGNRKHKADIFGNYPFQRTFLKGAMIGGGARYQSAINADLDTARRSHEGGDFIIVDAIARYPLRFGFLDRRIRASLQINVRNLLNERDPMVPRSTATARRLPGQISRPRAKRFPHSSRNSEAALGAFAELHGQRSEGLSF